MFLRFFREWVLCPNINGSFSPSPIAYAYASKISFASTAFCVKGPYVNTDFNPICGTDIILFSNAASSVSFCFPSDIFPSFEAVSDVV